MIQTLAGLYVEPLEESTEQTKPNVQVFEVPITQPNDTSDGPGPITTQPNTQPNIQLNTTDAPAINQINIYPHPHEDIICSFSLNTFITNWHNGWGIPDASAWDRVSIHLSPCVPINAVDQPFFCAHMLAWAVIGAPELKLEIISKTACIIVSSSIFYSLYLTTC